MIATFYSHFAAMKFKKLCDERNIPAKLMPVPRTLSSSCGTCVKFEGNITKQDAASIEELEKIWDNP